MCYSKWIFLLFLITISHAHSVMAQEEIQANKIEQQKKIVRDDITLSDSIIQAIKAKKLTRFIYESIVEEQNKKTKNNASENKRLAQYNTLSILDGKKIIDIQIHPINAWENNQADSSSTLNNKMWHSLNLITTTTTKNTIKRNIFVKIGDPLNPEKVLENERILRTLPFIRDAQIIAEPSPNDSSSVILTVITKDIFPYGITGKYSSISKWDATLYNKNIFGQGHEVRSTLIHNASEKIDNGVDFQYKIQNFTGSYSNVNFGYTHSYEKEGFMAILDRPFLRTDTRWGGSMKFYRYWQSNSFYDSPYSLNGFKIDYAAFDTWGGYAINLSPSKKIGETQLVISGRYRQLDFFKRPEAGNDGNQIYANSNLILGSICLANRYYIRDNLVRGFGTTEDIPKGYFHELVVGFDNNEFTDRWYSHLFLSTGNLINKRSSYLYLSAGIGTFFNSTKMEQGELQLHANYISKQIEVLNRSARYFFDLNYLNGLNRFNQEYITINNTYGIRGFSSDEIKGQKKLSLKSEMMFYLKRKIIGYNIATFALADIGFIGQKNHLLLNQDFYAGIGGGIRLRNDKLIFGTIQLRLTLYPKHPSDQSLFGFQLSEDNSSFLYEFQPRMPEPLEYR